MHQNAMASGAVVVGKSKRASCQYLPSDSIVCPVLPRFVAISRVQLGGEFNDHGRLLLLFRNAAQLPLGKGFYREPDHSVNYIFCHSFLRQR